jgi:hypothetical protein
VIFIEPESHQCISKSTSVSPVLRESLHPHLEGPTESGLFGVVIFSLENFRSFGSSMSVVIPYTYIPITNFQLFSTHTAMSRVTVLQSLDLFYMDQSSTFIFSMETGAPCLFHFQKPKQLKQSVSPPAHALPASSPKRLSAPIKRK